MRRGSAAAAPAGRAAAVVETRSGGEDPARPRGAPLRPPDLLSPLRASMAGRGRRSRRRHRATQAEVLCCFGPEGADGLA